MKYKDRTMKCTRVGMGIMAVWAMTAVAAASAQTRPAAGDNLTALKAGDRVKLAGGEAVVTAMDVLPLIRNEFSDRFKFDCFGAKSLKTLRTQEKLDAVAAPGKTEFDKQVLLLDWAHKRIKHFGPPPENAPLDALGILKDADANRTFNCDYYAEVLREALLSMGYISRKIGLKGAHDDGNGSEHSVVEVWSNQYRKWVLMDPTLNMYFLKGATPLNAFELRQEWFYKDKGKALTIVIGKQAEKHTTADMPIKRETHAGFGTLQLNANSLGKFLYVAYVPASLDGKPDYAGMFITKDKLCAGVEYHTRTCPRDPAAEPYWPMQQAALTLAPGAGTAIAVKAGTMTPDFDQFRYRVDDGAWTDGPPPAEWKLHKGENTLAVQAVNQYGVEGAVSKVALELK
jgi:hypothetical protein